MPRALNSYRNGRAIRKPLLRALTKAMVLKFAVLISLMTWVFHMAAAETVEWKKIKNDDYKLMSGDHELAELVPNANQGNVGISSPINKKFCGVNWPHFLMLGQGWLTDRVESE